MQYHEYGEQWKWFVVVTGSVFLEGGGGFIVGLVVQGVNSGNRMGGMGRGGGGSRVNGVWREP